MPGAERASSSAGKRPEEDNESAAKEQERAAQESDVPFEVNAFRKDNASSQTLLTRQNLLDWQPPVPKLCRFGF